MTDFLSGADDRRWLPVHDAGAVGTVRRAAAAAGASVGLPHGRIARLEIVAAELASNLWKHAVAGTVLVRGVRRGGVAGVELVGIDKGPGMADVSVSSRDGYSTSGTLGVGLGSIMRQSSELEIYSAPGSGTIVAATVWPDKVPGAGATHRWTGALSRAMTGEEVTGDGYAARCDNDNLQVMVCDGLGHGPLAAAASHAAVAAFRDAPTGGPGVVVDHLHRSVRHTRGLVVMVVELDPHQDVARFAGVGNVSATVVHRKSRRGLMSYPGIVGHQAVRIRELAVPFPDTAVLVLHTDGVTDRWNLDDYPGLAVRAPLLIAAAILRDAGVRRDDAAVLVAKAPT